MDDLDGVVHRLRDAGIEVAVDPESYPNGRFASLHDPDGNPVQLREAECEGNAVYLVTLTRSGPEWDPSKPAEQQTGWAAHAAYMDDLVAQRTVVLGGPLGDEHRVVLVIDAANDETVRAVLAGDPWSGSHLHLDAVEEWTVRLNSHDSERRGSLRR